MQGDYDQADEAESRRPKFGTRYLTQVDQVYKYNAWDNVRWSEEQEEEAKAKINANKATLVSSSDAERYECEANKFWDQFYIQHNVQFFKDRNWLFAEFPQLGNLVKNTTCSSLSNNLKKSYKILEVGCGVGNAVFPLLQATDKSSLFIYACDFSQVAIDLLKEKRIYDEERCNAFVWDICDEKFQPPFEERSLDCIMLIFVLSSLNPLKFKKALQNLIIYLKPGGQLLFRDYGLYDMAQLRFKNGQCISDNFYVRRDGTRVYFFTCDEVDCLFKSVGLQKDEMHIDRRLQVNRFKQLKMYRVWIQCIYTKPT
ncbi:methyltransferase domain protein [Trichinella spiralis]|uniref:tRNA N(3)-methylcytidine methyltransferase n=1 Tax=Trichinella spiralis TaxID=6334 RepID=E5S8W3_TRISP|nr:methyltransferase domain protein [Trichinella spiralis]KRY41924.1 Methyltransferase-like protein 2 [Trichinella spiralis]